MSIIIVLYHIDDKDIERVLTQANRLVMSDLCRLKSIYTEKTDLFKEESVPHQRHKTNGRDNEEDLTTDEEVLTIAETLVLKIISTGPVTSGEIAEELVSEGHRPTMVIDGTLSRLRKANKIDKVNGKYILKGEEK
jgi:hypothetical protein